MKTEARKIEAAMYRKFLRIAREGKMYPAEFHAWKMVKLALRLQQIYPLAPSTKA
jgi:hypothetical protein